MTIRIEIPTHPNPDFDLPLVELERDYGPNPNYNLIHNLYD